MGPVMRRCPQQAVGRYPLGLVLMSNPAPGFVTGFLYLGPSDCGPFVVALGRNLRLLMALPIGCAT